MLFYLIFTLSARIVEEDDCVVAWGKCGGQNWQNKSTSCCDFRQYCLYSNDWYSECVNVKPQPWDPAPASETCGPEGRTWNSTSGTLSSREIAEVWIAATTGLTEGRHPGGVDTCVAAVSVSLGECQHPAFSDWMTIDDPVCTSADVWQVTSADNDDRTFAGCTSTDDPCCDARLAYAHAYWQGGATVVPDNYCDLQNDCKVWENQWYGTFGNVTVDETKPGAVIPDCRTDYNPWYPEDNQPYPISADQEPCYWGPFTVAGGGHGKSFFYGFYGWGGFFMHYIDSKAGMCDPSPGYNCNPEAGKFEKYPNYLKLATDACNAVAKKSKWTY